jgi:NAD(P)-dependent dehydrogenase (short-subunit alcohol dehydrogenase family)
MEVSNKDQVALIVGGGPGVSASCAKLFASVGMKVAVAARTPTKPVLQVSLEPVRNHESLLIYRFQALVAETGCRLYTCDASNPAAVKDLFVSVTKDLGTPDLVVHNIDGRPLNSLRVDFPQVDPANVLETLTGSAFSAFLVAQEAARLMLAHTPANIDRGRGTIIFTNASAAIKGFAKSAAFAMACQAKTGLSQSMARELAPQGIHIVNVPIDGAIGWEQEDGSRKHRLAGTTVEDNMLDPAHIAVLYLQLHRQQRSTWTNEVVLRPWLEKF